MTIETVTTEARPLALPDRPARSRKSERLLDIVIRSIVPVVLALVAGGILLLGLGRNPLTFYGNICKGGIQLGAWQDSAIIRQALAEQGLKMAKPKIVEDHPVGSVGR